MRDVSASALVAFLALACTGGREPPSRPSPAPDRARAPEAASARQDPPRRDVDAPLAAPRDPVAWLRLHPEVTHVEHRALAHPWRALLLSDSRSFACLTNATETVGCRDLPGPIEDTHVTFPRRDGRGAGAVFAVTLPGGRRHTFALRAPELETMEVEWEPPPDDPRPRWYPARQRRDRPAPTLPETGWRQLEPAGDRGLEPFADHRVRMTHGDGLSLADLVDDDARRVVCVRSDAWRCAEPVYALDVESGHEGYVALHRLDDDPLRVVAVRDEHEHRGRGDDQAGDAIRALEIYEADGATLRRLGTLAIGASHWDGGQIEASPTLRFVHAYRVGAGCLRFDAPESQRAPMRAFLPVGRARPMRLPRAPDALPLDPRRETPWLDDADADDPPRSEFGPYEIVAMDLEGEWSASQRALRRGCDTRDPRRAATR